MVRAKRIDEDVLAVLSKMTIDGNVVLMFPETLERRLYQRVDEVLRALGGTWRRGSRAKPAGHVFDEDPTDRLAAVIATGDYACPRLNDFFPTPAWLATMLVEDVEVESGNRILEPSAGEGALVEAILARGVERGRITCYEADPHRAARLVAMGMRVAGDDFLQAPPLPLFDRVVMNPPFSRRQDVAHVLHAVQLLRPGGRLAAILSAGLTYRQDRAAQQLRDFVALKGGRIMANADGAFAEAGTAVRTVRVVVTL